MNQNPKKPIVTVGGAEWNVAYKYSGSLSNASCAFAAQSSSLYSTYISNALCKLTLASA